MNIDNKRLARRPWSLMDSGFITHIDGVTTKNLKDTQAFYLCMHTSQAFLNENGRGCNDPRGWFWPKLIVENFSISNLIQSTGILVTDGILQDIDTTLSIQNGIFLNLDKDSIPIIIRAVNFSIATIRNLVFSNVTNKIIDINTCLGKTLILDHLTGIKVKRTENSRIDNIVCTDCIELDLTDWEKDTAIKTVTTAGIKGSFALHVMIDGKLYKAEIPNADFKQ